MVKTKKKTTKRSVKNASQSVKKVTKAVSKRRRKSQPPKKTVPISPFSLTDEGLVVGKASRIGGFGLSWRAEEGDEQKIGLKKILKTGNFQELRGEGASDAGLIFSLSERSTDENTLIGVHVRLPEADDLDSDPSFSVQIDEFPGIHRCLSLSRYCPWWTEPSWPESPGDVPPDTVMMLWELDDGSYGAMAPLLGSGFRARLEGNDGSFRVVGAHYGSPRSVEMIPGFIVGFGENPYTLLSDLYAGCLDAIPGAGRLRVDKPLPPQVDYLGWCTWNACYTDVSEQFVLEGVETLTKAGVPIRWVMIDDGWQSTAQNKLMSFVEDSSKFPHGIGRLFSELKQQYGIRWTGLWHPFQCYWEGIHPNSPLVRSLCEALCRAHNDQLVPDPVRLSGFRFYRRFHQYLADMGADFVRVDNQATAEQNFINGQLPFSEVVRDAQAMLQASAALYFNGHIINCMSMTTSAAYFWSASNLVRTANDYNPNRPENPAMQVLENVYNALWVSHLAWPDFDTFQSHAPAALFHAVLRAVSGGPVYLSDVPGKQQTKLINRLCFSDGRIPRPDAPAQPTRDTLMTDPARNQVPVKVFNRSGEAGLLAVFNANAEGKAVRASFRPADVEGFDSGKYACYEVLSGEKHLLTAKGHWDFGLDANGCRYFVIAPVADGFSAIGLTKVFNAPGGVARLYHGRDGVGLELYDSGPFLAWCRTKPKKVLATGRQLSSGKWRWKDGWLEVKVPSAHAGEKPLLEIMLT